MFPWAKFFREIGAPGSKPMKPAWKNLWIAGKFYSWKRGVNCFPGRHELISLAKTARLSTPGCEGGCCQEGAYMKNEDITGSQRILDKIDKNILSELQKDGRISNADLSKRVGLKPFPDAWHLTIRLYRQSTPNSSSTNCSVSSNSFTQSYSSNHISSLSIYLFTISGGVNTLVLIFLLPFLTSAIKFSYSSGVCL